MPSTSQPATLPLMLPNSRYVLVTNWVSGSPSCGKYSEIRRAGALKGLFGAPTGSRTRGLVTAKGLTPGAYPNAVKGDPETPASLAPPTCSARLRNHDPVTDACQLPPRVLVKRPRTSTLPACGCSWSRPL